MSTFYIISQLNGLVLAAKSKNQSSGLHMEKKNTSSNCQKWTLTKENYLNLSGTEHVIDIDRANQKSGASLIMWGKRNRLNQQWVLTQQGYIESCLNSLVLDIVKSNPSEGAKLWMWNKSNSSNQKWLFVDCYTGEELFKQENSNIYPSIEQQQNYQSPSLPSPLSYNNGFSETSYPYSPVPYDLVDKSIEELPLLTFELNSFLCPLTKKRMKEPVILLDSGITYEKASILEYMAYNEKDPINGANLQTKQNCKKRNF
eukprot:gene5205-8817_t